MIGLIDRLIKEAAVIEGAPLSFAFAWAIAIALTWFAFRQRIAFLQGTISDYKERLEAVAPAQLTKSIKIIAPRHVATVRREIHASGSVMPQGSSVQVLVLSGDGLWYPQDPATYRDGTWTARCWLGDADTRAGSVFKIVAIDGAAEVREPIRDLPRDVARSKILTVYRA